MSIDKKQTNITASDKIIVRGARTHNLKNITVEMPRNKMIAITGLSGSGKSSLAFDTIFAEGQRRYVESLSAYARQFLNTMQKPDVDEIIGLSPAISIDQKSRSNNPRSTVATITEIYDYMRILFARIGKPHCLECGREIKRLSHEEIMDTVLTTVKSIDTGSKDKKVMAKPTSGKSVARTDSAESVLGVLIDKQKVGLYAPLVVGRKGEYYQLLYDLLGKGYERVLIDGEEKKLREQIILSKTKKHDIDVLVDEFFLSDIKQIGSPAGVKAGTKERLSEALERALQESEGLLKVVTPHETKLISSKFMCPYDGFSYPEIEPRLFSFNSPYGACSECNGLGTRHFFGNEECKKCHGARLREEALHVYMKRGLNADYTQTDADKNAGKGLVNIVGLTACSISEAKTFFDNLKLSDQEKEISKVIVKEIQNRLDFMINVGIDYLSLNRRAHTLSGGEAQRIRLASQLGSGLVGALYVLDEPTIGLHQRDNDRLVKTLLRLRDMGNTIIVVEHDEDTIFSADYIIDIGPGAGVHGGHVVASGYLDDLLTAKTNPSKSLTLDYLRWFCNQSR
jgi:excinuclease ABC subunit A